MSIDPMNVPILGDVAPANPPRPVRLASVLLLGNVALAVAHRLYASIPFDVLFAVPLIVGVWFALSVRAGRAWARTAATVLAGVAVVLTLGFAAYGTVDVGARWWGQDVAVDLAVIALSVGSLLAAIHLLWRSDSGTYFLPSDGTTDN